MSQRICSKKYNEASFGALHHMRNDFFARARPRLPPRSLTDHSPCNSIKSRTRSGDGSAQGESGMALLELKNVSKHFGAIHALNDVSLSLEPGRIVGLMGDNGAGKSTLVKIIAGNFRPTHGTMQMEGQDLSMHRPIEARRHGIEIVHQDLALCDNLSAAANVFLGREIRKGVGPFKILDYAAMYRRAGQIFAELRSETRPRSGQADVRRTATSGCHCPNPDCRRQDRSDGRTDRGHFGAAGRRGP